jgi:hypothetical protein
MGVTLDKAQHTVENATVDANGAFFVSTTAGSFGYKAAGSYTDTFIGSSTANTISPAFNVAQVLTLSFDTATADGTGTIDFMDTGLSLTVHGFTASTAVTATAGDVSLITGGSITTSGAGAATIFVTMSNMRQEMMRCSAS